jgi:VWFA-related protein
LAANSFKGLCGWSAEPHLFLSDASNACGHLWLIPFVRRADHSLMMTMGLHRLHWPMLLGFLALSGTLSPGESAELTSATYHSTVSEVRLTFFATERNQSVAQLQPDDFAVVDNGLVVRDFRSFSHADVTQREILLLVDSSESVLPRFRKEITDALQLVSQTPSVADDRVSVVAFGGGEPRIVCEANCQSATAEEHLSAATADGQTPLFDAVLLAADFLTRHHDPAARPVLILFSDGEDNISRTSASDAIAATLASEAQIYAVDVGNAQSFSHGTMTLQYMAAATGGRYFTMGDGAGKVLRAVLEDLQAGYIVTYRLPNRTAGFHSIRILPTRNPNLQFRCRHGYQYAGAVR